LTREETSLPPMPSKHGILIYKSLILLMAALFLASCGKKEVKRVAEESAIAQEAFLLIEDIRYAYVKNDRSALQGYSTTDGYRELIGAIKNFESVELTFTPRWVEIEDSTVYLNVAWSGTWTVMGKKTEERGMAIFVLGGRPLKLNRVLRANPFRQPE